MPNKDDVKEIYFAVRKDDGTYGEPILIKTIKGKASDLYADSDSKENTTKSY
ncbi:MULTISPECIES: hypothetical protein [Bacillus]|uniref:hypothetical protein n=1 Tax=Bacillus TaxID=1386 RepID=UPI0004B2281E|nr:hypothetical protein [Bacillus cereus]